MPKPSVNSVKELLEKLSREERSKQISIKEQVIHHSEISYSRDERSFERSIESRNLQGLLSNKNIPLDQKWEALTTYMLDEKKSTKTFYGIIYQHLIGFFQPKSKVSHRFHLFAHPAADIVKEATQTIFKSAKNDVGFVGALIATPLTMLVGSTGIAALAFGGVIQGVSAAVTRHPLSDEQQKETLRRVTALADCNGDTKAQLINLINTHYKKHTSESSHSSGFLSTTLNDETKNTDEKIKAIINYMTKMEDGYFKNNGKLLYNIISEALEEIERQEHRPSLHPL